MMMTDYRSIIAHILAKRPFDEESVHDCVCTYVRAERDSGRSASDVIVALSALVERPGATSAAVRHTLTRCVIPWCVEAYFGMPRAGAPCVARLVGSGSDASLPSAVSRYQTQFRFTKERV